MLPSSGYFRSFACPYFSSGLCERPHCHFRHEKLDAAAAAAAAAPVPEVPLAVDGNAPISSSSFLSGFPGTEDKPDLLFLVREAIRQVQKEVECDGVGLARPLLEKAKGLGGADLKPSGASTLALGVIPPEKAVSTAPKVHRTQFHVRPAVVAEYRPTPIAHLKKLHEQKTKVNYGSEGSKHDTPIYIPSKKAVAPTTASGPESKPKPSSVSVTSAAVPIGRRASVRSSASDRGSESEGDDETAFSSDDSSVESSADDGGSVVVPGKTVAPTSNVDGGSCGERSATVYGLGKISAPSVDCVSRKPVCDAKKCSLGGGTPGKLSVADEQGDHSGKTCKPKSPKSVGASNKSDSGVSSSAVAKEAPSPKGKNEALGGKQRTKVSASGKHKSTEDAGSKRKRPALKTSPSKHVKKSVAADGKSGDGKKKKKKIMKLDDKAGKSPKTAPAKGGHGKGDNKLMKSTGHGEKHKKKPSEGSAKPHRGNKDDAKKRKVVVVDGEAKRGTSQKALFADSAASTDEEVRTRAKQAVACKASPSSKPKPNVDVSSSDAGGVSPARLDLSFGDFDLDDEQDTYEECLQIFNEYVPEKVTDASPSVSKASVNAKHEDEFPVELGKKRIAHNQNIFGKRPTIPTPRSYISPSEAMHKRFLRVEQIYREAKEKNVQNGSSSSSSTESQLTVSKSRVAHVPKVNAVPRYRISSKGAVAVSATETVSGELIESSTVGNARTAHLPKIVNILVNSVRPTIPPEYGSKVPINIRQRYLNFIIDECLKIYDQEQDAFDRGLAEEKNSYDRSSNRTVYLNVVANTIKRLRNEQHVGSKSLVQATLRVGPSMERRPSMTSDGRAQKTVSHEFVLGGKRAASVSYSIERQKKPSEWTISCITLYNSLKKYILSKEQLVDNGFPLPHPVDSGRAVIVKKDNAKQSGIKNALEKVCRRCGTRFQVSAAGDFLAKEECFYHWGRAYKVRSAGTYETRYSCCQSGSHSEGCCVGKLHVYEDNNPSNLKGFVKTLPKSPPLSGSYGVFALDCEMGYTNMGIELIRVTVVGQQLKPVYEALVKPENPIIDYNTRFSGIAEGDLAGIRTNLRDVQAVLLSMFSDKTILIGHSLESDFKALKLIHETVVDTSVVFPHKMGPPYKKALRTLVGDYLQKIIQNNVDGHDSLEDAQACMELMLWKVKEDLK